MNKARRHELKMLKYKKRLKNLGLKDGEGKFYCYRSTGQPCSCLGCAGEKYNRAQWTVRTKEELEACRNTAYEYLVP